MNESSNNSAPPPPRCWPLLLLLLGAGLLAGWVFVVRPATFLAPIEAVDVEQGRMNSVPPAPDGRYTIEQTITSAHDGLSAVELLLTRSTEATESDGRLTFQLFDDHNRLIAEESRQSDALTHNQPLHLRFAPQPHSAHHRYILKISGEAGNRVAVWGYDMDVYDGGEMRVVGMEVETAVQELRFTTRYQLAVSNALPMLVRMGRESGLIFLLALLFLPMPGLLLFFLLPRLPRMTVWARLGTVMAAGIALIPIIWQGWTLVNGRFSPLLLWILWGIGWTAVIVLWKRRPPVFSKADTRACAAALPALLIASLIVRLLAVRDLAYPPWVDASRHALITAVMAANGQVLTDYAPYMPDVTRFPYHFGFHTLAASLQLMGGWPMERLLLAIGVLLNALVPLTIYAAVSILTRKGWAALLAALLVALPFFFPAYYATWGRMTQLTAVLILPVLISLNWKLLAGGRRWRDGWPLVGILTAGLFYIHARVFLIYLPFAAVTFLLLRGRNGRRLLYAALLGAILAAPRILYLIHLPNVVAFTAKTEFNYNAFPTAYVTVGWERAFLAAAAAAALVVLFNRLRGQKWTLLPFSLMLWVAALFFLLAGHRAGLPETWLINLNSMYISMFVPLALFLGVTAVFIGRWARARHWLIQVLGFMAVGGVLLGLTLFGIRQQINIINPQTVLVRRGDTPVLKWAEQNLPADAHVAVNSWRWLGYTYAGSDGGAWLVPLTRLSSTTPPADYIYNRSLQMRVNKFNEGATAVADWSRPDVVEWLRQEGVTHILIGQRGGFLDPSALNKNPLLTLLYAQNGTFVFAVMGGS